MTNILKPVQKKKLEECIFYYTSTTGKTYSDFISALMSKSLGTLNMADYANWLANELFTLLEESGLTIDDCIANKDVLQAGVLADKSRGEGEFYTPEPWCREGRDYLKAFFGENWGKVAIWDASCGTANLMRTANYPNDKLFLSTLLDEDVAFVKQTFPEATVFQGDFVNDIDYDENNNYFSRKLPDNLLSVLKNNEPICFFMNPPYLVGKGVTSDIGSLMHERGLGSCATDILYQFFYRILTLVDFYHLTNVSMGIYGGIALMHSVKLKPLLDLIEERFKFVDGMFFRTDEFANTSRSVGWVVPYTLWTSKTAEERENKLRNPIVLSAKVRSDGTGVMTVGKREFKPVSSPMCKWVMPKDVIQLTGKPQFISLANTTGVLGKQSVNALGAVMSDPYVIRGTRRCMVSPASCPDAIDITPENFWRSVASFCIRVCYKRLANPFDNCQFFSAPDETIDGYNEWLANCLVLFLFDFSNYSASYRNWVEPDGSVWNIGNKLFPLPIDYIRGLVKDKAPEVYQDSLDFPTDNSFILNQLNACQHMLSDSAKTVLNFAIKTIERSLTSGRRAELGYTNSLQAWDVSFQQIRRTEGMWSEAEENEFACIRGRLTKELAYGIFKFGFLSHYNDDYANIVETNLSDEELSNLEIAESEDIGEDD